MIKFQGTYTALVTPFIDQKIDEEGLATNIRFQIKEGIDGIVPLGSTGESPTLDDQEQENIISIAVREAKGKIPIIVGTGTYCTKKTIENTKRAKDLGADAALVIAPYYNKPTQEGIFRHFEALARAVELPLIIYNNQSRCGTNIETSTLLRLAEMPNIKGVKEASGNIHQAGDVIHQITNTFPGFKVLSGDDIMTLPMISLGASGVISVASNLVPRQVNECVQAALCGRSHQAREMHFHLLPLFKAIFLESNPIPIKAAMNLCGMPSGKCRLPLYDISTKHLNFLKELLGQMQLI